jgi:hypothetical protein
MDDDAFYQPLRHRLGWSQGRLLRELRENGRFIANDEAWDRHGQTTSSITVIEVAAQIIERLEDVKHQAFIDALTNQS